MVASPRAGPFSFRATTERAAPVQVVCEGRVPAQPSTRVPVIAHRDEWHVADRWWTEEPVRRNYYEVVLETGRNVVVFRDEASGTWFRQAS